MSCKDVFRMFEGYYGPYFTPSVDADGNLTWSNNAGLPNPPAINIKGEPGTGLEISGLVATEADLPATAEDWTCYLVGTEVPYTVYTFNPNSGWISLGQLASGPKGDPGAVYTPSVSPEGLLSWTNDGGLPNPQPVDIKGPKGDPGEGDGLSNDVKQALLQIAQKVAYIDTHGDEYYQDLYDALYPPAELISISAVFSQGQNVVYDDDSLNSLKQYLTVTGTYDDSSTATILGYTLSGTLTAGTSTITVSYEGLTTTFTVTVTHRAGTYSVTNTLSGCTTSNDAASVVENGSYSATITPSLHYTLTGATVSVTMGGTDITSTAYSNGTISIASVTGALVITVTAVAVALSSISAVYTQSGTVYDTDTLDSLKADLIVTATYDDSTTEMVPGTDYTLSGTLTAGTSTITVSYEGKTDTFTVTVTEDTGLPRDYTPIEYVWAKGDQWTNVYVSTGFIPDAATELEYKAAYHQYANTGHLISGTNYYALMIRSNGRDFFANRCGGEKTVSTNNSIAAGDPFVVSMFRNGTDDIYVDESKIMTLAAGSSTPSNPLYIFGYNGTAGYCTDSRIYYLKIYDNGTLARDYIPCINPSNVVGLYDVVNGNFITSTSNEPLYPPEE